MQAFLTTMFSTDPASHDGANERIAGPKLLKKSQVYSCPVTL